MGDSTIEETGVLIFIILIFVLVLFWLGVSKGWSIEGVFGFYDKLLNSFSGVSVPK